MGFSFLFDGIEDAFDDVGALSVLEGVFELTTGITLVLDLEDGNGVNVLVGEETDGALVGGVDGVARLEILCHTAVRSMKRQVHVGGTRDIFVKDGGRIPIIIDRASVAEALRTNAIRRKTTCYQIKRNKSRIECHLHNIRSTV